MKFQNCIINKFCSGHTDGRTHAHTDKPKAICPFNFFQSWGHKHVKAGFYRYAGEVYDTLIYTTEK